MIKIVYFDMDGVLCDFNKQCDELDCWRKDVHRPNWAKMQYIGSGFWSNMEPIPEGVALIKKLNSLGYNIGIFSAIHLDCGKDGKREWLKKHLPFIPEKNIKIINNGNFKFQEATPDSFLIDDKESNVEKYKEAGGYGILFTPDLSLTEVLDALNEVN